MAKVFVKARGLNSLPACACRVKTGRNPTLMTRSAKKSEGPTSLAASMMTSVRLPGLPSSSHSSSFLWAFSTMMMEASTMAPMAMAMPLKLMTLDVSPR